MKNKFQPKDWGQIYFPSVLFACIISLSFGMNITQAQNINEMLEMSEQLDKLDRIDFIDLVEKANQCIGTNDFHCADEYIEKADKVASSEADKRTLINTRKSLYAEREQVRIQELAQAERIRIETAQREAIAAETTGVGYDNTMLVAILEGANQNIESYKRMNNIHNQMITNVTSQIEARQHSEREQQLVEKTRLKNYREMQQLQRHEYVENNRQASPANIGEVNNGRNSTQVTSQSPGNTLIPTGDKSIEVAPTKQPSQILSVNSGVNKSEKRDPYTYKEIPIESDWKQCEYSRESAQLWAKNTLKNNASTDCQALGKGWWFSSIKLVGYEQALVCKDGKSWKYRIRQGVAVCKKYGK